MKKRNLLYLLGLLVMASCSAPKHAYYFDHYDYNAGKKKKESENQVVVQQQEPATEVVPSVEAPLTVDNNTLVASASEEPVALTENTTVAEPAKSYKEMTKSEKKAFRKDAKNLIKTYIKAKKDGDEVKAAETAQAMDKDLRLAAIFGAVGIVALLIGGDVFYIIGAIALIIGVVLFVMWLTRQ